MKRRKMSIVSQTTTGNCRSVMAHIDELRLTFQGTSSFIFGITETELDIALFSMLKFKYQDFGEKQSQGLIAETVVLY